MSTRTYFASISSIGPIRDAVASGDRSLVEAVMDQYVRKFRADYGEQAPIDGGALRDFRGYVESMILCPSPPKAEPGCWNYVIKLLARHFDLAPDDNLPFNEGWTHYDAWEAYRALVAGHITPKAEQSLGHLENGRPLKGSRIDHDGCVFAWLAPDEVVELSGALSRLDSRVITDEDLVDFHETLVESLKTISERKAALFMAAH
jgi:hypothetical protein